MGCGSSSNNKSEENESRRNNQGSNSSGGTVEQGGFNMNINQILGKNKIIYLFTNYIYFRPPRI